jgi:hypothetical protein
VNFFNGGTYALVEKVAEGVWKPTPPIGFKFRTRCSAKSVRNIFKFVAGGFVKPREDKQERALGLKVGGVSQKYIAQMRGGRSKLPPPNLNFRH